MFEVRCSNVFFCRGSRCKIRVHSCPFVVNPKSWLVFAPFYGLIHSRVKKIPASLFCPSYRRRSTDGGGVDGSQVGGAFLWRLGLCVDGGAHHYCSGPHAWLLRRRPAFEKAALRKGVVHHSRRLGSVGSRITADRFDIHGPYPRDWTHHRHLHHLFPAAASAHAVLRDGGPTSGKLDVSTARKRRENGGNSLFYVHAGRNRGHVLLGALFYSCCRPQAVRHSHRPGVGCIACRLPPENAVWREKGRRATGKTLEAFKQEING